MPLNQKALEALRKTIESRRAALRAEITAGLARSRSETYGELTGGVVDRADESVADLLVDLGNAEIERDAQELRELDAAFERFAAGGFGQCEDCAREISAERLRAQPGARRCIDCQRLIEHRQAHPPGTAVVTAGSGRYRLICALALFGAVSSGWTQEDKGRGRFLYETYCGSCHYEKLHERPRSRSLVKSMGDLRTQVIRWAPQTKHRFTSEEIEAVVGHLNRSHYKLDK